MKKALIIDELMKHGATKTQALLYVTLVSMFSKFSSGGDTHHILPRGCGWWKKYEKASWNLIPLSWGYHIALHAVLFVIFPNNRRLLGALKFTVGGKRLTKHETHKEQIITWYAAGKSTYWIAEKVGITPPTVNEWLTGWGIDLRSIGEAKQWNPPNPDELIRRYEAGEAAKVIGEKEGVADNTVKAFLIRNGVSIRGVDYAKWIPSNPKEIIQLYLNGRGVKGIGTLYGVSHRAVNTFLRDNGIPLRGVREAARVRTQRLKSEAA
jgi:hypothetical protein